MGRKNLNKMYMLGHIVGGSPDAYIGNSIRRGVSKYFPNTDAIDETLSKATGYDLLGSTDEDTRRNLFRDFTQPAMLGEQFGKEVGDFVKSKMGENGNSISLSALKLAAAIHLEGIDRARRLIFPHIQVDDIPATKAAFEALMAGHLEMTDDNGALIKVDDDWDLAKLPENDSLSALIGIFPDSDPANSMFATDNIMLDGEMERSADVSAFASFKSA